MKYVEKEKDCSFCENKTKRFILADCAFVCDECFKDKCWNKYRKEDKILKDVKE